MEELETSASQLRAAVASECWAEARHLLPEYGRLLEAALRAAAPGTPPAARLAREARELLDFTRRMAQCSRAHAAARLADLERSSRYRPALRRCRRWEVEA